MHKKDDWRIELGQWLCKVERFNRTLIDEWAYARKYTSEAERCRRLDSWLHLYNHHRCHTAIGGQPPITRVDILSGTYN